MIMQNVLGSLFHVTVLYIGSHVVSWSIIINNIHVECFVHRLSWSLSNSELCACKMSAVPYRIDCFILAHMYVFMQLVIIINSINVECFVHRLSWSWSNTELCPCWMCAVPYSTFLYWFLSIGSHVVSWSLIINSIHVECFVQWLSWSWSNDDLWSCRMGAVPYSTFLYWLLYIGSHVVSLSNTIQVECFVHWSWSNNELWAWRMCSVPYSMLPYWLFYIGSHVISWSIIINTIHVECFVQWLSWSWSNSDLWSCRMSAVPYSTFLYWLLYIGSHVVSLSIIINSIQVECFVHWLSWSWSNNELWAWRMCSVPYSMLPYWLFYIGSHVVSWSIIHPCRVSCAMTVLIVEQ